MNLALKSWLMNLAALKAYDKSVPKITSRIMFCIFLLRNQIEAFPPKK